MYDLEQSLNAGGEEHSLLNQRYLYLGKWLLVRSLKSSAKGRAHQKLKV